MSNLFGFISLYLLFISSTSNGCHDVTVEKGQPASLKCKSPNTAKNVTWQLIRNGRAVNITTCSFDDNKCVDSEPSQYRGYISKTLSNNTSILNITSSRINEAFFRCQFDSQSKYGACQLYVCAWPTKPVCTMNATSTFVDINCTTDNVYPRPFSVLHRREVELTNTDMDPGYPNSVLYPLGSGSDGDYKVTWLWRIPIGIMKPVNTFYEVMWIYSPDENNKTAAVSDDFVLSVPAVMIPMADCPVDHYGVERPIMKGSGNVTCKCVLVSRGSPPGFARWYTKGNIITGVENKTDGSSALTFSYNASDPNQSYECRPITSLNIPVTGKSFIPEFTDCIALAAAGGSGGTSCKVPKNVTSLTWQMLDGNNVVNISTCNFVTNNCSKSTLSNYYASVINVKDHNEADLYILSYRPTESQFRCLTENGEKVDICPMAMYGGPTKPNCSQNITDTDFEITCTSQTDTTPVHTDLYRRQVNLSSSDISKELTVQGSNGEYNSTCTWRIPWEKMLLNSTMYVVFSVESFIWEAYRLSLASDDIVLSFRVPEVTVNPKNCTSINGNPIKSGVNAKCLCELKSRGYPPGQARWFNNHNWMVGEEDTLSGSSTITMSYYDHVPSYSCRPVTPLKANVTSLIYRPNFTSASAQRSLVIGIQAVVTVLGAVCVGIIFPSI